MRELKDLTVKGMALVKSPANRKRFLMHKSEEGVPDKVAKAGFSESDHPRDAKGQFAAEGAASGKEASISQSALNQGSRAIQRERDIHASKKASAHAERVNTASAHTAAKNAHEKAATKLRAYAKTLASPKQAAEVREQANTHLQAAKEHEGAARNIRINKSQGLEMSDHQEASIQAAPSDVISAVRAIKLTKGEDEQASDALEAVGHLLHANPQLSLSDVLAAGRAAGLADVEKAAPKKSDEKDEYEEDDEDEMDEGDESDDDEEEDIEDDEDDEPKGKGHPSLPPEINRKVKARKSHEETSMAATEKAQEREFVSKSEYDEMVERVAKAHERLEKMEQEDALRVEKSANQSIYGDLKVDHDALARTTLALRKSAPKDLEALEATLKAANEQVRVAKTSGGSIFSASSSQPYRNGAVAKRQGDQFKQLVDEYLQKNAGSTRKAAIAEVAKSADAINQYKQLEAEG